MGYEPQPVPAKISPCFVPDPLLFKGIRSFISLCDQLDDASLKKKSLEQALTRYDRAAGVRRMKIPSNKLACRALFLQAAREERGRILFGGQWEKTCGMLLPFVESVPFPSLYLEFPLVGEPFLDVTVLYSALIVTNSYLLSQKNIDMLARLRVNKCQVTIDGLGDKHDATRRLAGGGSTFERIESNLRNGKIPFRVVIRQNVHSGNLTEVPKVRA